MNVFGSEWTITGAVHVAAACAALVLGVVILARKKGTQAHRVLGCIYLSAMLAVNAAALMTYHEATEMAVFHYLAFVSLATISAGYVSLRMAKRSLNAAIIHGFIMSWSYAGLAAAGTGQAAVHLGWDVLWTVMGTLAIFGIIIHGSNLPLRALDSRTM